jgi:hypothetical protein
MLAMLDLFSLASLEQLQITDINDIPFSVLKRSPQLKILRLFNVKADLVNANDQSNVAGPAVNARLHTLSVGYDHRHRGPELIRGLIEPSVLPGIECLTSLCIVSLMTREEVESWQKLLEVARNTLSNFGIFVTSEGRCSRILVFHH